MALPLTIPSTPEFTAQLQRVETLHQQLKTEHARAQEFLAKLRRGEEIQAQALQPQAPLQSVQSQPIGSQQRSKPAAVNGAHSDQEKMCCCRHHQSKPLTEKEKKMAEEYRKARLGQPNLPPLPMHVDEREVRDLEKRVRGLEGRVRGFEGLPPDREMALLEVERLRRELEGLARRREGLFAGLGQVEEKGKAGRGKA
ncbi:MAG: hypothetical protein ASARMPREDX12_004658 [Alectoria sarmentosa]|nr:MAG: hypothetical protein ASARMPREDX12_004658 [Alectoria sarmentosa]